jgi:hypothetical protein
MRERKVVRWIIMLPNGGLGFVAYAFKPKRVEEGCVLVRLEGIARIPKRLDEGGK